MNDGDSVQQVLSDSDTIDLNDMTAQATRARDDVVNEIEGDWDTKEKVPVSSTIQILKAS